MVSFEDFRQAFSEAGDLAEARLDMGEKIRKGREGDIELIKKNRRMRPEYQNELARAAVGRQADARKDISEVAATAPAAKPKAGLTPPAGSTEGAGLTAAEKEAKAEKKITPHKFAGTEFPDLMKRMHGLDMTMTDGKKDGEGYRYDFESEQGEDESNISHWYDKFIGDPAYEGMFRGRAKIRFNIEHMAPLLWNDLSPTATPADRKKYGFKNQAEMDEYQQAISDNTGLINTWFAERPDSIETFLNSPPDQQVQTVKAIIGKYGQGEEEKDANIKKQAEEANQALAAAGVPGKSAIEENPPDPEYTLSLMKDPGLPGNELKKEMDQHERIRRALVMLSTTEDLDSGQGQILQRELQLRTANIERLWGIQAVNQFDLGDPRLMQTLLKEKSGGQIDVQFQPTTDGKFNMLSRGEDGKWVTRQSGMTMAQVRSDFKYKTDEAYKAQFDQITAMRAEKEMEFQMNKALEDIKGMYGIARENVKGQWSIATARAGKAGMNIKSVMDEDKGAIIFATSEDGTFIWKAGKGQYDGAWVPADPAIVVTLEEAAQAQEQLA